MCKLRETLIPFGPTVTGRFRRRVKRFSVEVEINGRLSWASTNNTGGMLGLLRPDAPVLLTPQTKPGRKLPYVLQAMGLEHQGNIAWAGVNTAVPNRFLREAFTRGLLPWASEYTSLKLEVMYGESRLDGCLSRSGLPDLWLECKNVTLVEDDTAAFPDAVTARGAKHLRTLRKLRQNGCRAAMLYLVQRPDAKCFAPADYIDPEYAMEFAKARQDGVEMYVLAARVHEDGVAFDSYLPLLP